MKRTFARGDIVLAGGKERKVVDVFRGIVTFDDMTKSRVDNPNLKLLRKGGFWAVVFDTETNGLKTGTSVLSFAMMTLFIKVERSAFADAIIPSVDAEFERFYFPKEPFNYNAIRVNGLDADAIRAARARSKEEYPEHFEDDTFYRGFWSGFEGRRVAVVAHNIGFDLRIVKSHQPHLFKNGTKLCTLKAAGGRGKLSQLFESCAQKPIRSKKARGRGAHDALYDVFMAANIFVDGLRRYGVKEYVQKAKFEGGKK